MPDTLRESVAGVLASLSNGSRTQMDALDSIMREVESREAKLVGALEVCIADGVLMHTGYTSGQHYAWMKARAALASVKEGKE